MKENLIFNNNYKSENLMNEIKKMSYIKYLILLFSIIRFGLMFLKIFLIPYFPKSFKFTFFTSIIFLYITLIFPILTICLLFIAITGTINRDFWVAKKQIKPGLYACFCCCCIMLKNVNYLKILTFINSIIELIWASFFLYYLFKDSSKINMSRFFPYSIKKIIFKIILYFIDSTLQLCLFYFFYYSEYFLKRVEKYLEYYKRLLIKNRNKEAEFVRNTLPENIEDYTPNNEKEEELQKV